MEQRDFARAALEYVCLIQEVQERKKFEFVETVSRAMQRVLEVSTKFAVVFTFFVFSCFTLMMKPLGHHSKQIFKHSVTEGYQHIAKFRKIYR